MLLFFTLGFSIYLNYVFNTRLSEQKLQVITQDKLAETNVEVMKKEDSIPINYDNIPSYLYSYVDCLNKGINKKDLSEEIQNRIQRLNVLSNNYSKLIGFAYEDLNTGFSLEYQPDSKVFAASTTKAPLALYVYKQVDEGKLDLNKKYVYTSNYYADGTGIIKNNSFNTSYSLQDLVKYSIIYSDNVAYLMLSDIVNKKDVSAYFESKGSKNLYNSSNQSSLYKIFGELSPSDGNIYMKELYKYSLNNTENSRNLLSYFKSSALNNVKEATKLEVAHKYGWTDSYVHDMALVFDENPYVLTITTTMGDGEWGEFVKMLATKIQEIHKLYWSEVNNYCKSLLD